MVKHRLFFLTLIDNLSKNLAILIMKFTDDIDLIINIYLCINHKNNKDS